MPHKLVGDVTDRAWTQFPVNVHPQLDIPVGKKKNMQAIYIFFNTTKVSVCN